MFIFSLTIYFWNIHTYTLELLISVKYIWPIDLIFNKQQLHSNTNDINTRMLYKADSPKFAQNVMQILLIYSVLQPKIQFCNLHKFLRRTVRFVHSRRKHSVYSIVTLQTHLITFTFLYYKRVFARVQLRNRTKQREIFSSIPYKKCIVQLL